MKTTSIAAVVRHHVRLNAAQRVLELYNAGAAFESFIETLSPEMRRATEGLLRAAAESWGNAVTTYERAAPPTQDDGWLR